MLKQFLYQKLREKIIKSNKNAYLELMERLNSLLQETSEKIFADFLIYAISALEAGENIKTVISKLEDKLAVLPTQAKALIARDVYNLTRELYAYGFNLVSRENKKLNIAFNLKDLDAINTIGGHNIFWVENHYNDIAEIINNTIRELYENFYSRQDLAARLAEKLSDIVSKDAQYWYDLADHIATKTKELGRVSGYEKAGIKYVKVKAILDARTSKICRNMHGRIIPVERLVRQRDAILSARSKQELIDAQRWIPSFTGRTKDLPDGLAGPPYHFRCRTTTVAYFEELDGEPVSDEVYQYVVDGKVRKEKVLYKHFDRELGREIILTEGVIEHILAKRHNIKDLEMIKSSIRGIKKWGISIHPDSYGHMAAFSDNGVYIIFRDNVVYNMFRDSRGKHATEKYFKRHTDILAKRWVEQLKQLFMGHHTR